jgi:hypothetical protein
MHKKCVPNMPEIEETSLICGCNLRLSTYSSKLDVCKNSSQKQFLHISVGILSIFRCQIQIRFIFREAADTCAKDKKDKRTFPPPITSTDLPPLIRAAVSVITLTRSSYFVTPFPLQYGFEYTEPACTRSIRSMLRSGTDVCALS